MLARALDGAAALFWVVPPNGQVSPAAAWLDFTRPAAAVLARHGVRHVVGVSALGRGTPVAGRAGLVTASLAMDDLIASTGVAYRALANPSFMDNLLEDVESLRAGGVWTGTAAPDRPAPAAATRDIAAAGARLLLHRDWTGSGEVPVLGPEDISPIEMAQVMSEVLGRPIRYQRQLYEDLSAELIGYGLDKDFAAGMADMMRAKDDGLDAGVLRTPDNSLGMTFRQWCTDVLKPAVEQ